MGGGSRGWGGGSRRRRRGRSRRPDGGAEDVADVSDEREGTLAADVVLEVVLGQDPEHGPSQSGVHDVVGLRSETPVVRNSRLAGLGAVNVWPVNK